MLLGHLLLSEGPRAHAAAFWFQRERIEVEAASVFADLAEQLEGSVSRASSDASSDELRHADMCRELVEGLAPGVHPPVARARRRILLAPHSLPPARRGLYGAVALGCVTESLSVALLMEIQGRATDGKVAETAHAILKDEIRHSRFGWGALARAHSGGDISWLVPHLPAMIAGALAEETETSSPSLAPSGSLEGYGILSPARAREVCMSALTDIVVPGFAHFGLELELASLNLD